MALTQTEREFIATMLPKAKPGGRSFTEMLSKDTGEQEQNVGVAAATELGATASGGVQVDPFNLDRLPNAQEMSQNFDIMNVQLEDIQRLSDVSDTLSRPNDEGSRIGDFFSAFGGDLAEAATNVPSSAMQFGSDVIEAVKHPVQTASNLVGLAAGVVQKLIPGEQSQEKFVDNLVGFYKDRYGSLEQARETFTQDPVGFLSDAALVLTGGGAVLRGVGTVGKISGLPTAGRALTRVGTAIEPLSAAAGATIGTGRLLGKTAGFGVRQMTGLSDDALAAVRKNPVLFEEAEKGNITRMTVLDDTVEALDNLELELSSTGEAFQGIRASGETVSVPKSGILKELDKRGLDVDGLTVKRKGPRSSNLTDQDIGLLNDAMKVFDDGAGNFVDNISADEALNARQLLDQSTKFEGITTFGQDMIKTIRGELDGSMKEGIKGLSELDESFASQKKFIGEVKSEIIDRKGNIKSGAISKLANLTKRGKELVLEKMEKLKPGISEKVRAIKALEDVKLAGEQKVGTYFRGIALGGGAITGNVPLAVVALIMNPAVFVPVLKRYSKIANIPESAVNGVINSITKGNKPSKAQIKILKDAFKEVVPGTIRMEQIQNSKRERELPTNR